MSDYDRFGEKKDILAWTLEKHSGASPAGLLAVLLLIAHAFLTSAAIILGLWGMAEGGYAIFVSLFALPVLLASGICCLNGVRGRGSAGIAGSLIGLIAGMLFIYELQTQSICGMLVYGLSLAGYVNLFNSAGRSGAAAQTAPAVNGPAQDSADTDASIETGVRGPRLPGEDDPQPGGPDEGEMHIQRLIAASRTKLGQARRWYPEKPQKPPLGVWLLVLLCLINFALAVKGVPALKRMQPSGVSFLILRLLIPLFLLYFVYLRRRGAVLSLLAVDLARRVYSFSIIWNAIMEHTGLRDFGLGFMEMFYAMDAGSLLIVFYRPLGFILAGLAFLLYVGFSRNAKIYFYSGRSKLNQGKES